MLQKTIPLRGDHRALLRLASQDGQTFQAVLDPPPASGCLFLAGDAGQVQPVPLSPEGAGSLALDFIPLAALVYDGTGFPLAGGFAGRPALLEQSQLSIRLQGLPQPAAPPTAPAQPPDAAPSPAAGPAPQAAPGEASPDALPKQAEAQAAQAEPSQAAPLCAPAQPDPDMPGPPQGEAEPCQAPAAQEDAPPEQPCQASAVQEDAPPKQPCQAESASNRQQSPVLLDILQRAQALFAPQEGQAAPARPQAPAPTPISNPFPRAFPQSVWKRVEYPGRPGHYLVGEGMGRGGAYTVYALPGAYAPVSRQPGFGRFLRAADGSGYWVRIVPRRG